MTVDVTADPAPTTVPVAESQLIDDLVTLGLRTGDVVMVHTSLKSLGFVIGGAQVVLAALRATVGTSGTIVMPAQSWQLSDPAFLREPGVPPSWWPAIRQELPVYDPARTPSQTMGVVAELFRTYPGTSRSGHPHRSIAANGPAAEMITAHHDLDAPAGEQSPVAVLYDLDARVLLLGATASKITALHLAEHRADFSGKHLVSNGAAVVFDGKRRWVTWEELAVDDVDFVEVTDAFVQADPGSGAAGPVGYARAQLIRVRPLIDFAVDWFSRHR